MDYKAFKKINEEAEEALAERRFLDTLALIKSVAQVCGLEQELHKIEDLRQRYTLLLKETFVSHYSDIASQPISEQVTPLFTEALNLLTIVRTNWILSNQPTAYAHMAKQMEDNIAVSHMFEELKILSAYSEQTPLDQQFFNILDSTFGLFWCFQSLPENFAQEITPPLLRLNLFVRRTIVSALFLHILENFGTIHLDILLMLAEDTNRQLAALDPQEQENQQTILGQHLLDLQARCAVCLTLIARRYAAFLQFLPHYSQRIHDFLSAPAFGEATGTLFRALINQALTDRVNKRVDDIVPIIKETFEKQQPQLGTSQDNEQEDKDFKVEVRAIKVTDKEGRRFFRKMMDYARGVNEMRQNEMDINASNMRYMKNFKFFNHPAHWLYPFTTEYPELHDGLYRGDKLNKMTLSIMNSSRFCDSDRYSYVSMMKFLHDHKAANITEQIQDQLEKFQDEEDEDEDFGAGHHDFRPESQTTDNEDLFSDYDDSSLNPFFNYCQTLHRFFTGTNDQQPYPNIFTLTDDLLLPCQPFFADLFTGYKQQEYTVETLLHMGAYEQVIILCNQAAETDGINADLLQVRGLAYMHSKQWRRALSDFQQAQLFQEDDEISIDMAHCHEALHEWEDALPLLSRELDRQGDTPSPATIEEMARCHIQLQQWDEAAGLFYRLEFMGQHLTVARRGIAWCALHQKKMARAIQYYQQLIEDRKHGSWEDRLNLGHALWLSGQPAEALQTYKQFVTRFNRTKKNLRGHFAHWTEAFREDARSLLQPTFCNAQIALMLDAISLKD